MKAIENLDTRTPHNPATSHSRTAQREARHHWHRRDWIRQDGRFLGAVVVSHVQDE